MEFKTAYGKKKRYPTVIEGKTRTKMADQASCDINALMAKYERTGVMPHLQDDPGRYLDLSTEVDYQDALNTINYAREVFGDLSAEIRARFENDPAKFLAFAESDENEDQMIKMGLLPEKVPEIPLKASEGAKPSAGAPAGEEPKLPLDAAVEPPKGAAD